MADKERRKEGRRGSVREDGIKEEEEKRKGKFEEK